MMNVLSIKDIFCTARFCWRIFLHAAFAATPFPPRILGGGGNVGLVGPNKLIKLIRRNALEKHCREMGLYAVHIILCSHIYQWGFEDLLRLMYRDFFKFFFFQFF